MPQKHQATVKDSALRIEMNEEKAENAKARDLHWNPLSWLGTLRPTTKLKLKLNIDPTSEIHQWLTLKEFQCWVRNHEAAQMFVDNQKELRMLADAIRNQDPNAESRVELMSGGEVLGTALITCLRDAAGRLSLVFNLSITHDRIGSSCHVQQNGSLSHIQDLDSPLCIAAKRKLTRYRQQYADNQNISFLPSIMTTSSRIHC
jgi:hypothetical protein